MKGILRYKNIVVSLIILIIFIFVVKNAIAGYFLTLNELKSKMSALEKGKLLIERWNAATLSYDKISESFFTKDPLLFKTFVEKQTKKYDINVSHLSPSRQTVDFYIEAALNLRASTDSYTNIVNFIKSIEGKKVLVETLRVKSEEKNKRTAEMTLKSFILE